MAFQNLLKALLVGLQTVVTALALIVGIVVVTGASLIALVPNVGGRIRARG